MPWSKAKNLVYFDLVGDGNWCQDITSKSTPTRCTGSRELYNHKLDPHENQNIARHAPASLLARLSAKLRAGPNAAIVGAAPIGSSS